MLLRLWLVLVLVVGLLGAPLVAGSAAARGEDVCPEPNDVFQAACFLGPDSDALGFIARPFDVDAYRIETRDFGARLQIALPDRPLPYRLNLTNWAGVVVAEGPNGVIDTRVDLPGSYFVFVDLGLEGFDEGAPYRITYNASYPGGRSPDILYSAEFRGGGTQELFGETGTTSYSDEDGDYSVEGGKIVIRLKNRGTDDDPTVAKFFLSPDPPDLGPIVEDFMMVIDTRVDGAPDAGYLVLFRFVDGDNYYELEVGLREQMVALSKFVDGELEDVVDWVDAPSVSTSGNNRTVIRAVGDEIRVNVNGSEVIRTRDSTFSRGMVGYGATSWGAPPTVYFDNILVTTVTNR